jgi:hypothetical protein
MKLQESVQLQHKQELEYQVEKCKQAEESKNLRLMQEHQVTLCLCGNVFDTVKALKMNALREKLESEAKAAKKQLIKQHQAEVMQLQQQWNDEKQKASNGFLYC